MKYVLSIKYQFPNSLKNWYNLFCRIKPNNTEKREGTNITITEFK
jgi:hypothetical protein